jgi:hypothetical protein
LDHPTKFCYSDNTFLERRREAIQEELSLKDAFLMEKKIQKWSHSKKKALIENNIEKLKQEAECKNESNSKNFVV